jgi:hypothetical protein
VAARCKSWCHVPTRCYVGELPGQAQDIGWLRLQRSTFAGLPLRRVGLAPLHHLLLLSPRALVDIHAKLTLKGGARCILVLAGPSWPLPCVSCFSVPSWCGSSQASWFLQPHSFIRRSRLIDQRELPGLVPLQHVLPPWLQRQGEASFADKLLAGLTHTDLGIVGISGTCTAPCTSSIQATKSALALGGMHHCSLSQGFSSFF